MADEILSDSDFADEISESDFADSAPSVAQQQQRQKPGDSALDFLLNAAGTDRQSLFGKMTEAVRNRTTRPIAAFGQSQLAKVREGATDINAFAGDLAEQRGVLGAAAGTALGTVADVGKAAADFTLPQDELGAGLLLAGAAGKGISKGYGLAKKAITPAAKKAAEFAYKVGPNIYPSTSRYALEHWDDVIGAPSIKKAQEIYAKAAGGLKHWAESVGERFGTLAPSEKIDDIVAEARTFLEGKGKDIEMTPQKALDAIQAINLKSRSVMAEIKDRTLRAQKAGEFGKIKDKLYDYLESNGAPELRKAGQTLRNAFVKDEITGLFPKNKSGDANVLRTLTVLNTVGGAALFGGPPALAAAGGAAAAMSPSVVTHSMNALKRLADLPEDARKIFLAALAADEPTK